MQKLGSLLRLFLIATQIVQVTQRVLFEIDQATWAIGTGVQKRSLLVSNKQKCDNMTGFMPCNTV